ncbi:MAG: hypothetical protein RIS76_799 [Verrucomicrobiota bacterium]|jgi:ABC-type transport system involved in multi-copper enzyme maturation permease subunit
MNLTLPIYRNSFHPAWLLLLLAPVLALLASDVNEIGIFVLSARIALVMAFLGSLLWWRHAEAPSGLLQLLKELRVQLPGCLVAVGFPGLLFLARLMGAMPEGFFEFYIGAFSLGCLVMGATAFGSEFEQRTMAALLSQPGSRASIFLRKMGLLVVLLLLAWLNLALDLGCMPGWLWDSATVWRLGILALVVCCTSPLFTLITRSTLAGAIFTAAVPALIVGIGSLAGAIITRLRGVAPPEEWATGCLWVGTPVYMGLCAWLGWRQFARLQVQDAGGGTGGGHVGFHPLSVPTDRLIASILPFGWLGQLVRKELRLHVVPWLVSGVLVGLWALLVATRILVTDEETVRALATVEVPAILAALMGVLILLVSGSACVAEERQLGTLDWQLTQPLTVARQWRVKVAVALGMALICGVALPVVLLAITYGPGLFAGLFDANGIPLAIYSGVALGIHFIAVYASSFSRSTMKATAAAIGIMAGLCLVALPVVVFVKSRVDSHLVDLMRQGEEVRMTAPAWVPSLGLFQALAIVAGTLLAVLLFGGLLYFGSRNFRGAVVSRSAVVRQIGILSLLLVVPALALAEGLVHLMVLNLRAEAAQVQAFQLDQNKQTLVALLRIQEARGAVDPDLLKRFGLISGASPEAIAEAVLGNSSPHEVQDWVGTLSRWKTAITQTNRPTGAGSGPVEFRMDPQLMRRYGLIPGAPKTNSIPADPTASPK